MGRKNDVEFKVVDSRSNDCPLGSVRDTNRPQLIALLKENNFKHMDIGILPDESSFFLVKI